MKLSPATRIFSWRRPISPSAWVREVTRRRKPKALELIVLRMRAARAASLLTIAAICERLASGSPATRNTSTATIGNDGKAGQAQARSKSNWFNGTSRGYLLGDHGH